MASGYYQLPGYRVPENAMLNMKPVGDAIDGMREAGNQNAMFAYQQKRDQVSDQRANAMLSLQQQAGARQQKQFDAEQEKEALGHLAGIYQQIEAAPEADRAALYQRFQPIYDRLRPRFKDFDSDLAGAGYDSADFSKVGSILSGFVGGYQNPLDTELKRAQINKLNSKNAVDEAIADLLTGGAAEPPPAAAPAPANRMLQPQSYPMPANGGQQQQGLQQISDTNAMAAAPPQASNLMPGVQLVSDQSQPVQDQETAPQAMIPNPGAVYNLPGDEIINTPFGKMSRDRARRMGMGLAASGKGEAGRMMIDAASGSDPTTISKSTRGKIDDKEFAASESLARLTDINSKFDPRFLTIESQLTNYGVSWLDSFDSIRKSLPPEALAELERFTKFKQSAQENINLYIKEITGAQMSEAEAKRLSKATPDPNKDSPTEFKAKLDNSIVTGKRATARLRYLRSKGFAGKPWEVMPLDGIDAVIDQRGAEIEQQLKQQNPQADPQALQGAVKKQLSQEFGI